MLPSLMQKAFKNQLSSPRILLAASMLRC